MAKKRRKKSTRARGKTSASAKAAAASKPLMPQIEQMRAAHTPIATSGKIKRPEFHVTNDLRATSDLLWQALKRFRSYLLDGASVAPLTWLELVREIRDRADLLQLFPSCGDVPSIAARLCDIRERDADPFWADEEDSAFKWVFVEHGEAGWIQLHDLADGFGAARDGHSAEFLQTAAIQWAETWMNARERQLCLAAELAASTVPARAIANKGPTSADLADEAGISLDTLGRIRKLAGVQSIAKGGAARQRRYIPDEVALMIQAALDGNFQERRSIAVKWAKWSRS